MKYNLSNPRELQLFDNRTTYLKQKARVVELKEIRETRTSRQNKALHLYFTFIANELNGLGQEFSYSGVKDFDLSMRYTPNIVKDFFWRPIQITLFEKESTTDLVTSEMNEIIEIINKFFADKGVVITFPSIDSLMDRYQL